MKQSSPSGAETKNTHSNVPGLANAEEMIEFTKLILTEMENK